MCLVSRVDKFTIIKQVSLANVSYEPRNIKRRTPYPFQERPACLLLRLHHPEHVLVGGGRDADVQPVRVGGHLADQLVVGEHAEAVQHAVVGHAHTTDRELQNTYNTQLLLQNSR